MRAWLVVVLAVWLSLVAGACRPAPAPSVTADQATQIAVQAFTGQYVNGQKVTDLRVLTTAMGPSGQGGPGGVAGEGADVWRVNIVATVTEANGAHYDAAAWIDVDPVTGAPHIVTQG